MPKASRAGYSSKETQGLGNDVSKAKYQPTDSQTGQPFGIHDVLFRTSQPPKTHDRNISKEKVPQKKPSKGWVGEWGKRTSDDEQPVSGENTVEAGDAGPVWGKRKEEIGKSKPCGSAARLKAAGFSSTDIAKDLDSPDGEDLRELTWGKDLDWDWSSNTTKDEMRTNASDEDRDKATADLMW